MPLQKACEHDITVRLGLPDVLPTWLELLPLMHRAQYTRYIGESTWRNGRGRGGRLSDVLVESVCLRKNYPGVQQRICSHRRGGALFTFQKGI